MRTLVTGGTGFVGLNVVEALLARGDEVVVLSDGDIPADAMSALPRGPGVLSIAIADVAERAAVDSAFAAHRPERVVHAAVITAGEKRELTAFGRVVDVNLKGTAHVLAAAADHGVRRFVYVSSGSAYGAALSRPGTVSEDTPPEPDTLYSITKHASERVCARFRELRRLDVVCARLGSVFGPWERDTGVRDTLSLPYQILQRARRGEDVILPRREPARDWIYSRDVAAGIVALLAAEGLRHTLYNVSAGAAWPAFAETWCAELRRILPALVCRTETDGEPANVGFLGNNDRAMMSIERIGAEVAFDPARDQRAIFNEYIDWLRDNAA